MSRPLPPPASAAMRAACIRAASPRTTRRPMARKAAVPEVGSGVVVEFGEAGRDRWLPAGSGAGRGRRRRGWFRCAGRRAFRALSQRVRGRGRCRPRHSFRAAAFEVAQFLLELVRVHDAPAAEAVEQAGLHLAGGGLGVGDAEDRVRFGGAATGGAQRGRSGLSSCRSRHWLRPRRMIRAGRLAPGRVAAAAYSGHSSRVGGSRGAHSSPPSSADHSARRARRS